MGARCCSGHSASVRAEQPLCKGCVPVWGSRQQEETWRGGAGRREGFVFVPQWGDAVPSGHGSCLVHLHLLAEHPRSFLHCVSPVGVWQLPASQGCTHSCCSVPVPIDCGDCHCKEPSSGCPGTVPIERRQQGVVVQWSEQMCWVQGLAEPALGQELPWHPGCRELWVWRLHWVCFGGCVRSGLGAVPTWYPMEGCSLCCFLDQPCQGQPKSLLTSSEAWLSVP